MTQPFSNWHSMVSFFVLVAFAFSFGLSQESNQVPDTIAQCWQELAAEDAEFANRAAARLVQDPESAVMLLADRLKAAEAPDQAKTQAWIRDLANANFGVRENASQALTKQGELAERLLKKALDEKLDLETRRRIDALLSKIDQPVVSPEKLRQIRAVEILEALPGAPAKELLERLANGFPEHRQTRLAQESLQRRKERDPVPEPWLAWAKNRPAADKDDPLPFGARVRLGTKRFRHEGQGRPIAFTTDGRIVISFDAFAVYFWETPTGKLERKIDIAAASLAVAPKGTLLALGVGGRNQNGAVLLWNWQAAKEEGRLDLPPGVLPSQLAFSADGNRVYCKSSDENLRAWDVKSGQVTTLWQPEAKLQMMHAFSADATAALVGSRTSVFVLDLKSNQKHPLPTLEREPRSVAFSPNGKWIAVTTDSSQENSIIFDAVTGKLVWRAGRGISTVGYSVRFSSDSKVLAVGSYRQEIGLWDVQTGKFLRSMAGSRDASVGAISADGRWLASTGQTLRLWNVETGERVQAGDGHLTNINGLAFSPRYDWVATFDYKEVRLWDPLTGKQNHRMDTGEMRVRGVSVTNDKKLVAAANPGPGESFVKVWETATDRQIYSLPGHGIRNYGRYADVRFSTDGRFLFSWGDDYHLRKWDLKTGRALMEIATLSSMELKNEFELRDVHHAWNSKIDRFFVLADGDLHTFDLNTGKEGPIVKLRPTARDACTFSPSGKYLAVAGRGAVAIQDVTSNKLTFTLELPARARAMAFSPDERSLAAAVGDRIVVVEMASGKVRLAFAARAQALTYSADGRFLVAAMDDTTALIWDWTLLAESRRN